MSFTVGFAKIAKEKQKMTTKQRLVAAAPVLVGSAGAGYGAAHYALEGHHNFDALMSAREAVRAAKSHGMHSLLYNAHKDKARESMKRAIKHGKKAKIGGGIYLAGVATSAALGYHRQKKQREEAKKLALKKAAEMKKTALSKETLQRAAQAATKKVELMPPGMRGYAVKPVKQMGRFTKALAKK